MNDSECVAFLQWALPRMALRWPGYRRVRAQACKRIRRRMAELGCADAAAYRGYLAAHESEWAVLDELCRITVTRFYRDRRVFETLIDEALPGLAQAATARGARTLRIWCAGCASGEEPYTLAIGWRLEMASRFKEITLDILATDADAALLSRAETACYPWSAVRNLPPAWRTAAFREHDGRHCLQPGFKASVRFLPHDLRTPLPETGFDLICCRNLAFTYFDHALQLRIALTLYGHLLPGGVLLLGVHEQLPKGEPNFEVISERLGLYRRPRSVSIDDKTS
ncbi:CheR family methyltransferase [Desulfurivibrio alkaliphilus]|uniref:MCP methyltransferase, CheR-type n=1 Tax=Desulfurivibrio alkaliphilus (strain DSM 19089 / UNIQEM U267 / AHT2) TaxID=589865 RepID=D6Z2E7_DESAT|nr:CheR family methyltransferase [Desulfurivibrio alkaliphilus]ADH85722.1 MCP methyltransferase, CheR-type [Desulfurivibrio alkaliphilus AHT 2]